MKKPQFILSDSESVPGIPGSYWVLYDEGGGGGGGDYELLLK